MICQGASELFIFEFWETRMLQSAVRHLYSLNLATKQGHLWSWKKSSGWRRLKMNSFSCGSPRSSVLEPTTPRHLDWGEALGSRNLGDALHHRPAELSHNRTNSEQCDGSIDASHPERLPRLLVAREDVRTKNSPNFRMQLTAFLFIFIPVNIYSFYYWKLWSLRPKLNISFIYTLIVYIKGGSM